MLDTNNVYDMGQYCCILKFIRTLSLGRRCTASMRQSIGHARDATAITLQRTLSQRCSNDSLAVKAKPELCRVMQELASRDLLEGFQKLS
jgi:hypothetical protein